MDKVDHQIKKWMEGEPGTHEIGPVTPNEFLQRIADSGMPGSLFAKLCLEHPEIQIRERLSFDTQE